AVDEIEAVPPREPREEQLLAADAVGAATRPNGERDAVQLGPRGRPIGCSLAAQERRQPKAGSLVPERRHGLSRIRLHPSGLAWNEEREIQPDPQLIGHRL